MIKKQKEKPIKIQPLKVEKYQGESFVIPSLGVVVRALDANEAVMNAGEKK